MKLLEKKRKPAFKVKAAEIKEKAKKFVEDKKNANNFVDVLTFASEASLTEDPALLQACISALLKILTSCADQGLLLKPEDNGKAVDDSVSPEVKFKAWLRERRDDATKLLLSYVENAEHASTREAALVAYVKIMVAENRRPEKRRQSPKARHLICEKTFNALVRTMLSSTRDASPVVQRFQEFVEKKDVVHCLLMTLTNEIKKTNDANRKDVYWGNFFSLLSSIKLRGVEDDEKADENSEESWLIPISADVTEKTETHVPTMGSFPEDSKLFTTVWTEFLQSPLPSAIFKKSLVILADEVMPHMTSPLALTDLLVKAYDAGGVVSVLALNGIFILIHRYNLEYPNFYRKLYSLLRDAHIFQAKYRARFFFLVDLFLTSTHIPAYLVCAFVKRLARLALTAPPAGIIIVLNLIRNLFIKHPNSQLLVNCPDGASTNLEDDPFLDEEPDPALCQAMESSLWEVESLSNHYYAPVAKLAKSLVCQPITGLERELSEFLEQTEDDFFLKESNGKFHHVPVNHVPPKSLFQSEDASFSLWKRDRVENQMEM